MLCAAGTPGRELHGEAAAPPSLRSKLRELYKRVHPDLFQNHAEARQANERSFQLLQVGSHVPCASNFPAHTAVWCMLYCEPIRHENQCV